MSQDKRRRFLVAAGAFFAEPLLATAQQRARVRRIGWLFPGRFDRNNPRFVAFLAALRASGFEEGRDYVLVARPDEVPTEKLGELATELVASRVDLILTWSSMGVSAAKHATTEIPVVFTSVGSPVEQGFVASLARPGGNITGIVNMGELDLKVLEAIRATLPSARRVGFLAFEPDRIYERIYKHIAPVASSLLRLELVLVGIANPDDLKAAFDRAATMRLDALFVPALAWFWDRRAIEEIARHAIRARLPSFGRAPIPDEPGAVMSFTLHPTENHERAGKLVARIFQGAHPRDLPVEQPTRFELVVNLRTAKALGLTVPPSILVRADRVIE